MALGALSVLPLAPIPVVHGAVADSSFTQTNPTTSVVGEPPVDGQMAIDDVDGRLYFRYNGAWHYCAITA